MFASQKRFTGAVALAVVASGFSLLPLTPAQASVSTKIAALPYSQPWSDAGLITANDDWSGVTGVQGYLGEDLTTVTGTDPQTITADGGATSTDVIANFAGNLNTNTSGGVIEAEASGAVALQGSGTADVPQLVFHLDLTGQSDIAFGFDAKDLDGSADNATQAIAVQYRVGTSGAYTNLPAGYVADATDTNAATKVTPVSVTLPDATDGAADVFVRVLTTNAVGNDEWVGIDNISVGQAGQSAPLDATAVPDRAGYVGVPIAGFNLVATGGTSPYTWGATGLPDGVTVSPAGAVSGTPTTAGTYSVTATVTDSASATDTVSFTITVAATPTLRAIAEVQGTADRSPFAPATGTDPGQIVRVQGVVTGMYADPYPAQLGTNGGLDGMYIEAPGADTDGASDAVFVFGNNSMPAGVAIGDSVEVIGAVSEFAGLTEITPGANGVSEIASIGSIAPRAIAYPTTEATREAREGELLAPTGEFTVTNSFSTNQFGEIGLATGDHPLVQPTEVAADDDTAALNVVKADNAARAVVLDDGTSINYLTNDSPQQDLPLPWLTANHAVRVGASVQFEQPVILDYRNNAWKFQPTEPVLDDGADVATIEDTRAGNDTPQDVGGDLKIATFNVLNYFNTTGEQYVANGAAQVPPVNTACTYYTDRDGNRIGNNTCGVVTNGTNAGNGPRGAATTVSYQRQRDKIVTAINALDADIVGLEEIENSMKLTGETNRDDAVAALVAALNADTGTATWRYVHSPGEALVASAVSEQDVIRPAFIYKQAKVTPVGQSDILFGTTEFANAREPLAQAFKPKGALDSMAFAVIVNHFKSKGDSTPAASGDNANNPDTGAFNGDRTRQATRLAAFAQEFAEARGIDAVFLAGDFNSYTKEDPMQALYGAGYTAIESTTAGEETYSFGGLSGSLDHVLGNGAAMAMVEGADIWDINAAESVAYQYSRYNYNVRQLFDAGNPFAASDHNPEIVGINLDAYSTGYTPIQIVATNDFHGRLLADGANAAGAAVLSGAVKEMRADNPDTVFAAAGDLIGASTFESFIQHDEPTIDALNEAGLQVSSAGNHEFDAGYDDLLNRVRARADWEYIASNVQGPADGPQLAKSFMQTFTTPTGPIKVGFVGAVTEDLPSLVSPGGMTGVTVGDIVESVNAEADNLRDNLDADLVVMLVHEGAPTTNCASMTDENTTWGHIVNGVDDGVDAIVSGHTHLAYNCSFPVAGWAGRDVTERPVVSAGQYGTNLNKLMFTFDNTTGKLVATSQEIVNLTGTGFAPDPAVTPIVEDAKAQADVLGAVRLGDIGGVFNRAKLADGTTENRGGESTLGNLVAEVQRWATETPEAGSAQIAFMNPGGLRADMAGTVDGATRKLTYKQAAVVQPFANTLVNMRLTGANLKLVLEQQWQRDANGNVPTRAFLRLGVSKGFKYTYDPAKPEGSRITGMWLNGVAIDPAASYSVTVNSFLATGGDNFRGFTNGTGTRDTGKADLQAMVDYMAAFADTAPLPVDYSQRAVGVSFPGGAPAAYAPGDHVVFNVSSWAMSTAADLKDTELKVMLGDDEIGTATLNNATSTTADDEVGKASVDVVLPADAADGKVTLKLVGATTGTEVPVVITVDDGIEQVQILATNDFHGRLLQDGANSAGAAVLSGAVKQLRGDYPDTVFAAAGDLIGASTFESFIQQDAPTIDALNEAGLEVSAAGNHEFDQGYEDLVGRVQDRADWTYLAANIDEPEGRDDLAESWTKSFGDIEVGFVGAVTEELPALVSPGGMAGVEVTPIVAAVNEEAARLKDDVGVDLVVMLVHEGSPSTDCSTMTNPATTWGNIVTNVSSDVDAIVSGHTHLAYDCSFPVADWSDNAVKQRPVVSAGQYGTNLNKLVFTFDATGQLVAKDQAIVPLLGADPDGSGPGQPPALFPADPAVTAIVDDAKAVADEKGAEVLGQIEAPFKRAKFSNGTTENRGGESTLGNLVAEVQRWATPADTVGAADIAFMNPGGLRADMVGTANGDDLDLTYRQAANVQPFANTLVNMDLTGAQIETVLEQQWQRTGAGAVPTRPFLRLGVSDGFTYTYTQRDDPAHPGQKLGEVTGMWLNGEALDPETSYSVTVNSFLASGGDNFRELANGSTKQDTGVTDLQSMVDYLGEFGGDSQTVDVDYAQRAVDVTFPATAPASYTPGDHVVFDLASLSMTDPTDVRDTEVTVKLGDTVLSPAATVTTTISTPTSDGSNSNDDAGTAHVDVVLPPGTPAGDTTLTVVGNNTGTLVRVPVVVTAAPVATVSAGSDQSITWGQPASIPVTVTGSGDVPTGSVRLFEGATPIGVAVPLVNGAASLPVAARSLEPGAHTLRVVYSGDATYPVAEDAVVLTVAKATSTVSAGNVSTTYGKSTVVTVNVGPSGATGTVRVLDGPKVLGTATVSGGVAKVTLSARSLKPGSHTLTAAYSGDSRFSSGSDTFTARVAKAGSSTKTKDSPSKVVVKKTRVTLKITVSGQFGVVATGKVKVKVPGQGTETVTLRAGKATLKLGKFTSTGKKTIRVDYQGSDLLERSTDTVKIKVVKK
jgi:5'-nucleotidase